MKTKNNEIVEILPNGERSIRFVPTRVKDTPKAMERLCLNLNEAVDERRIPTLLLIATFVFDFLCIHPFRDGNGRVSRLLTTLLLKEHGFDVGRYISLERLVEEDKVEYYRVLAQCSKGWSEGDNEILPGGITFSASFAMPIRISNGRSNPPMLVRPKATWYARPYLVRSNPSP